MAEERKDWLAGRLEAAGGGWIRPEEGLRALSRLVWEDAAAVVVARMDWSAFLEFEAALPPLLEDLASGVRPPVVDRVLLSSLREASESEVAGILQQFLVDEVTNLLGLSSAPSPKRGFFDLGMDSLTALELRNRVNRALAGEISVPNTAALDYPNALELAEYLARQLAPASRGRRDSPGAGERMDEAGVDGDGLLADILAELADDDS